jgi:hypothetical protein
MREQDIEAIKVSMVAAYGEKLDLAFEARAD